MFVNLGHLDYFNSLRRVTASRSFDDVYRPLLRVQYQAIGLWFPISISMSLLAQLGVGVSPCFRFPVAVCLAAASFLFRSISSVIPGSLLVLCPWCSSPLVCPLRSAIFLHLFCITRCHFSKSVSPIFPCHFLTIISLSATDSTCEHRSRILVSHTPRLPGGATKYCHRPPSEARRDTDTQWRGTGRRRGGEKNEGTQLCATNGAPRGSGVRPRHPLCRHNKAADPATEKQRNLKR